MLVGGFNPFEKYARQNGSKPQVEVNIKKYLKPPPSLICAMVKSRYIGDGHPTFNRNPYNWYIKPYYWVDDHPLLYGNNGSLDPSTYG